MQIFVYDPATDIGSDSYGMNDLPDLLKDTDKVIWVDLLADTTEGLNEAKYVLSSIFKFHPLTIEDSVETRNQPKVEIFPDYLYFIVHGIRPGEENPALFTTKELDGYLGPNYVVTFHREKFRSIKEVKQQLKNSTFACRRGPAYLLHQILDQVVDNYMPIVDDFDEVINMLEDRVFAMSSSENAILEEIMDLRRSVARLRRISSRQLDIIYRMSHGEFPQIPTEILPFYRDVYDHLLRISDLSETYRDLVNSLFDIHFAVVANKTNEIMKTLAIVSAIILPLSLIAGIYGMNFDYMPELKTKLGYFVVLVAMIVITILLIGYFKWRGWILQRNETKDDQKLR